MKIQLQTYILNNPNTWGRYLYKYPDLFEYVNSIKDGKTISEKAYIAINGNVEHFCKNCGKPTLFENFFKGYRQYCSSRCVYDNKIKQSNIELIEKIKSLQNFELLSNLSKEGKFGRKIFTVKNKICGHIFKVDNLSLFTNPYNYCSICGPKIRQSKMTSVNIERKKQQRKLIMKKQSLSFEEYSRIVRLLTLKVYKKYKHIINPQNLKISKTDYHIDHVVTIFDGWKNNINCEIISAASNLQIIPAKLNYKKSFKSPKDKLSELLIINEYVKEIKKNILIDEIQMSTKIISCNNGKLGIKILQDQKTTDVYEENMFDKLILFSELNV
jgi:hypothetical protein